MSINFKKMLLVALKAAHMASNAILDVYATDFTVDFKKDDSPLTLADKKAHNIIVDVLNGYFPDIPLLSEEGKDIPYDVRKNWEYFWLIDPLDGTKEFVKKNGEFTVNIALIHKNTPVLGVIKVPVQDKVYFAAKNVGAYKLKNESKVTQILNDNFNEKIFEKLIKYAEKLPLSDKMHNRPNDIINVIVSKSHMNKETEDFLLDLSKRYKNINRINIGSSLKLCTIAEGSADMYPRFAPTMEWDIAAGQIIVEEAGGRVIDYENSKSMLYNKEKLVNPWFLVSKALVL